MDARDYGMKYMNYKRVKGNNIQTHTLTPEDFKIIKQGLGAILDQESIEEDALTSLVINIEVNSSRTFFEEVPILNVLEGNISDIMKYRRSY